MSLMDMNTYLQQLGIANELVISRGLQACAEATELELAEIGLNGREHLLIPMAAKAWRNLKATAHVEGIDIYLISAFRSMARQFEIIQSKLQNGKTLDEVLSLFAPPGFSEHHTGRAIDIATPGDQALEISFDQTPAFIWLTQHAAQFNFFLSYPVNNAFGYQYEPWHWCYQNRLSHSGAQDA